MAKIEDTKWYLINWTPFVISLIFWGWTCRSGLLIPRQVQDKLSRPMSKGRNFHLKKRYDLNPTLTRWNQVIFTHCSKSSFFDQKFNFDFPRKLLILWGEKLVKMFRFLDFLAVDNFDFTRKIVKEIWMKNSWKCFGFVKIEFLDKNLTFRIVCLCNIKSKLIAKDIFMY